MTDPKRVEAGRKGGIASGLARRKKRERTWEDALTELLDRAPDEIARRLAASGNSIALIEAIKLAAQRKTARVRARERELDERESKVRVAERDLAAFDEWERAADQRYAKRQAEIAELERRRDDLRAAIDAEAADHGFALVDVDE